MTSGPKSAAPGARRVLIVDDEPQIPRALARVLRRSGYDVRTTASPREALAMMATSPADVVVSDFRMTEMTGTELLAEVARMYPSTRRLLLTGYADVDAFDAGLTVLAKPWDDAEILERCRA